MGVGLGPPELGEEESGPPLVQPVLQMASSDFVGRKEDSAALLREGGRVFFPIPVLLVGCES